MQPANHSQPRRLIVNADDFGRSEPINRAVIEAHSRGILTTASLMVNEPAASGAVRQAAAHPRLGVGLHLSLLCGQAALPPSQIPGLADHQGQFGCSPVAVGFRYFFRIRLRAQLEREIRAQLLAFQRFGLALDHLNGHLHLHLHPVVLGIVLRMAGEFGIRNVRLTRDPLGLNLRLASGRLAYRLSHALVFGLLARYAKSPLRHAGVRFTDRVFGLLQNARVDERFVLELLRHLPVGDSELYSHPSLEECNRELAALLSPTVSAAVKSQGIRLIRHQDL